MISVLKGEFRKLLTVRSTYVIVIICLVLVALFAGFGDGFRGSAQTLQNPGLLMSESVSAIVFVGMVLAFAGLLLFGHEYRYNTIMHTLTINNRRTKVLLAKVVVISVFTLVTSLLMTFWSPLCTIIGAHLHGHHIAAQHFDYWTTIWRCLFVGWGYAMYAFILLAVIRNQVGSIVTYLLIPLIGENILGHIFQNTQQYYPFSSLQAVVQPEAMPVHVTSGHEALITLAYIVGGWIVAWFLFLKRDAN